MDIRELRVAPAHGVALTLVIAAGLVVWAAILPATFAHNPWIYSWDSAAYLETANSLHAGRGLSHRVIHGLGQDIWEPLTLWPPGYSIMIATVMALGVSAKSACLVVTVGSSALSLALLGVISLRLVKWYLAAPIVAAVAASTAFQAISAQCLSDSAYYLWALASVACVIEWTRKPDRGWGWMFAAGLFAGAAYCTRNAALAVFAATGVLLLVNLAWRRFDEIFKIGLVWAAGAAVLVAPLVIHNLASFGRINPYDMPPSELSLVDNLGRAVSVVIGDITTFETLAKVAFDKTGLLMMVAAALAAASLWILTRRGTREPLVALLERYRLPIFVFSYALFTAVLIVLARSRYRWGEEISSRYMVQIYWALWLCLAVWGAALLRRTPLSPPLRAACLSAAFFVAAGLHLGEQRWKVFNPPASNSQAFEAQVGLEGCALLNGATGPEQFVLSVRADLLRIHCDVNARKLPSANAYDALRRPVSSAVLRRAAEDGRLWGLVIEDIDAVKRGDYGSVVRDIVVSPEQHPEFVRRPIAGDALVLQYSKQAL